MWCFPLLVISVGAELNIPFTNDQELINILSNGYIFKEGEIATLTSKYKFSQTVSGPSGNCIPCGPLLKIQNSSDDFAMTFWSGRFYIFSLIE